MWVEIAPYGFISRNYLNYVAGRNDFHSMYEFEDKTKILEFGDGSILAEDPTGHIVELDKRRRVVLVRVTKAEAEADMFTTEPNSMRHYKVSDNGNGELVMCMPGNITIKENKERVTVILPSGMELSGKKKGIQ